MAKLPLFDVSSKLFYLNEAENKKLLDHKFNLDDWFDYDHLIVLYCQIPFHTYHNDIELLNPSID